MREPPQKCSTPFGIREVGTARNGKVFPRRSSVLNAFRHQRGGHAAAAAFCWAAAAACSTPFGIREVGTPWYIADETAWSMCQRALKTSQ